LNLSIYEIVFSLFAKCECRIQIYIHAYLDGNLRFCENELKASDREWKMVLTP